MLDIEPGSCLRKLKNSYLLLNSKIIGQELNEVFEYRIQNLDGTAAFDGFTMLLVLANLINGVKIKDKQLLMNDIEWMV